MRALAIGIALCWSLTSTGQELVGKVLGVSGPGQTEVLVSATIYFPNTNHGGFTDERGEFKIPIPAEADRVIFSYIGYQNDTLFLPIQDRIEITLSRIESLGEVEIEAESTSTEMSLISVLNTQLISEKELTKAACCNLSESFDTNASIDASFTDAVTGTRQIRMLGLDGKYTQIMQDVVPTIRGLSAIYGLTYVPGPWVESIQVAKGVGSVANGYESMTGQINVSMKNPENAEKLYVNAYGNQGGRAEFNAAYLMPVGKRFSTLSSIHGEWNNQRLDMNNDGFMDNPLKQDIILRSAWKYSSLNHGWEGEYQATYLRQEKLSGQLNFKDREESMGKKLWGSQFNVEELQVYLKNGYVWQDTPWRSFGSQLSGTVHRQDGNFGTRLYDGEQTSFRANLLYATRINSETHSLLAGASFQYDDFNETLDSLQFSRIEQVPGAFVEYTWRLQDRFTLVTGMRGDYHNLFGAFWSPRLHARYSITDNTSIKVASGRGYRTSNVLMENVGVLASNRQIVVQDQLSGQMPNLQPEVSWNSGVNLLSKFKLLFRDATLSLDYYYTIFENQVVFDLENPRQALFYNLSGESFSHSAQIEFAWSPARRWDLKMAYRWLDVQTQYSTGLLAKPFVNKHRAFINLAYETKANEKGAQWKIDFTGNWIGKGRIPSTVSNPDEFQRNAYSDSYVLMNAQLSRVFSKTFEIYLGAENLGNFQQPKAILSPDDPFGEYFDASLIWGPVFGRMTYAGLRWKIN